MERKIASSPPLGLLQVVLLGLRLFTRCPQDTELSTLFAFSFGCHKISQPRGPKEFIFHGSRGWEPQGKTPAWLDSGECPFPGLQIATSPLCPDQMESKGVLIASVRAPIQGPTSNTTILGG